MSRSTDVTRAKMAFHRVPPDPDDTRVTPSLPVCKGATEEGYVQDFGPDSGEYQGKHAFRGRYHCNACGWTTDEEPRFPEVNDPVIRWDRDTMRDVLVDLSANNLRRVERMLDVYETLRREGPDKPCQSVVFHGPGHQSSTFCQQRGPHEEHYASLPSGGYAEWTDDDPYARDQY